MTPETWAGWAAIAGGIAAGITGGWRMGGMAMEKIRSRNGHASAGRNGSVTAVLARIEHEVSDREGSVRSMKHDLAQPLQVIVGSLGLMKESGTRAEKHLEKIAETLTELRIEAAERGNCCEHCGGK